MKRLIELANQIKDKKLREKTIKLLKEPEISNPEIVYPKANLEKIPSWIGSHHSNEGGLVDHTLGVVKISLSIAKIFEEIYKAKVNYDYLIAGALLHDIMKVFILKKEGKNWNFTGSILDHAHFTACELYARSFPEEVIHIVASHGGDMGTSGANPKTLEALIVFYADTIDASGETMIKGPPQLQQLQLLLMPKEEEQ